MLKVGDKIVWAEIKEGGASKRFILPSSPSILARLQALLGQYGGLFLVRHGEGQIQSAALPAANPQPIFTGSEFIEDHAFLTVTLFGHPEIQTGSGRYSQQLVDAVLAQEANVSSIPAESFVQTKQTVEQPESPVAPVAGQDELRAKLAASTGRKKATPTVPDPVGEQPYVPQNIIEEEAPTPSKVVAVPDSYDVQRIAHEEAEKKEAAEELARQDLRAQLNEKAKPQVAEPGGEQQTFTFKWEEDEPRYIIAAGTTKLVASMAEKLDKLLALATVPGKGVTGKQLAAWFTKSSAERGWDATFDILATKLKDLN